MADTIINVSSHDELMSALASATGGETIRLAGGDYGDVFLKADATFDGQYSAPVTITSADGINPASFSTVRFIDISNVTFDNVVFDYQFVDGDAEYLKPFQFENTSGITISNSVFDGDLASGTGTEADNHGTGTAFAIIGSDGVTVADNEFLNWRIGVQVVGSTSVEVRGNDVHDIRTDGMDFVENHNLLIEDNYFHDFNTAPSTGDHADMIQFWTIGTTDPTTDVIIRGNTLDATKGDVTQSFFMSNYEVDQYGGGADMYYRNFLIEENVILNGHSHGITLGAIDGVTIRNNTLLALPGADLSPQINVSSVSSNVNIDNNVSAGINGYTDQADWTLADNVTVQNNDPNIAGYYADEFVESSMFSVDGVAGWLVQSGSETDLLQAGATSLLPTYSPTSLRAAFDVATDPADDVSLIFDASYTVDPNGAVTPDNATFDWFFGDGVTATGQQVSHEFGVAGIYETQLVVTEGGGATSTARGQIAVAGADLLSFNGNDGLFHVQGYGIDAAIAGSDTASQNAGGGMVLDLGDSGTLVSIDRAEVGRIFGAESFDISFNMSADTIGSTGEIARLHGNFTIAVTTSNELSFTFYPSDSAAVTLKSGVTVNDGAEHDISIVLDDARDSLTLNVDGTDVAAEVVTGTTLVEAYANLVFGNPWGSANFDGTLDTFDINVTNNEYPFWEDALNTVDQSPGSGGGPLESLDIVVACYVPNDVPSTYSAPDDTLLLV